MPKNITQYELLISCPGDVKEEVDIIRGVVKQFNSEFSNTLGITIQERYWETDSYPASGEKPQTLLNKQFVNECDAVVAIFWTRFGTPTDEYGSGTEEEIENMIANNKQVFMYFSDVAVSQSQTNNEQYEKIQQFKEKYKDKGLYWTYKTTNEFKDLFYAHLTKYFLSFSTMKEIENLKKPDLTLELFDAETDEPIGGIYKFKYPNGLITRKELSQDDIFDEIEQYVTIDDINKYNDALPPADEVDSFNKQQKIYENAKNNCYSFKLSLTNIGNAKANDIYVDLYFPEEILVYYEDDIEDIKKPKKIPQMPENPVWKAIEEIENKKMNDMIGNLKGLATADRLLGTLGINAFESNVAWASPILPTINPSKLLSMRDYDYYIKGHRELSMRRDSLLHTRQYNSDEFSLIFTSVGEFEIQYSVMCEEWDKPIEGSFTIKAEY